MSASFLPTNVIPVVPVSNRNVYAAETSGYNLEYKNCWCVAANPGENKMHYRVKAPPSIYRQKENNDNKFWILVSIFHF